MWRFEFKNSDIFEQARGDGLQWKNGEVDLSQDRGALNKLEGRSYGKEASSFVAGSLRRLLFLHETGGKITEKENTGGGV